jgi:hypothetical protein
MTVSLRDDSSRLTIAARQQRSKMERMEEMEACSEWRGLLAQTAQVAEPREAGRDT